MDIITPGGTRLTHVAVDRWFSPSEPGSGVVTIDLSKVKFIDATGLVLVAATAQQAQFDGLEVDFRQPDDISVGRYIARMHLGQCLETCGVTVELPEVQEWDVGNRLIELHYFDPTYSDDLADRVYHAYEDEGGGREDAADLYLGVSEVLSNVVEHGGTYGGWAAMQVMPDGPTKRITFAVADAGRGLRRTLNDQYPVNDDSEAIEMAFRKGVSRTGEHGRGEGLNDLYQRVQRRKGQLKVWSGSAAGTSQRNGPVVCRSLNTTYPGTMIYASLQARADGEE